MAPEPRCHAAARQTAKSCRHRVAETPTVGPTQKQMISTIFLQNLGKVGTPPVAPRVRPTANWFDIQIINKSTDLLRIGFVATTASILGSPLVCTPRCNPRAESNFAIVNL